jgi:UDP-N-acetylglucosamine acyltransferase
MKIHPTAIVHPSAELAEGVDVQAYSIIEAGARVGEDSIIGPHCVIGRGAILGKNTHCFSGAQVGVPPQDLKHCLDEVGQTVIGDGNIFREFVTVSSSTVYHDGDNTKVTRIGDGCLFMTGSHVAHDCEVGDAVVVANNVTLAGHVTVHDRAIIGGLTGIHQFCIVGKLSFIGGMTRVNKDTLPYMIVEGAPARCFGPNTIGLERNGISKEGIRTIRAMYKLLYRSGLNTSHAVQEIEKTIVESPERATILDFIEKSQRGISK